MFCSNCTSFRHNLKPIYYKISVNSQTNNFLYCDIVLIKNSYSLKITI